VGRLRELREMGCARISVDLSHCGAIAGHARATGMILVTNNEKEFARVKELLIENWCME